MILQPNHLINIKIRQNLLFICKSYKMLAKLPVVKKKVYFLLKEKIQNIKMSVSLNFNFGQTDVFLFFFYKKNTVLFFNTTLKCQKLKMSKCQIQNV